MTIKQIRIMAKDVGVKNITRYPKIGRASCRERV